MPAAGLHKTPLFAKVCGLVGILCIANFIVWACFDRKYGGNALNGTIEAGRYFFSEHGVRTEVSPEVWQFSRSYTVVTIALFVTGALCLVIFGANSGKIDRRTARDAPGK